MCRMIAITNYAYARHEKLLESFMGLAKTGVTLDEDPPGHEEGWGIGWYAGKKAQVFKSGASLLKEKPVCVKLLQSIKHAPILMLHVRKSAWKNSATQRHAHPFTNGRIILGHNGTIRDFEPLRDTISTNQKYLAKSLDSEVFFHAVTDSITRRTPLPKAVMEVAQEVHEYHTYTSLTSIFSDGKDLYAYRDYQSHPEYYSLFYAHNGSSVVASSEPLPEVARWHEIDNHQMIRIHSCDVYPCRHI